MPDDPKAVGSGRPTDSKAAVGGELKVGKVSTLVGSIEAFDPATDQWECWEERLDAYFDVNSVVDDRRRALLLVNFIGAEQFRLLKKLTAPLRPTEVEYKDLVGLMQRQYCRRRILLKERDIFYNRRQQQGESLTAFNTELNDLADRCEFGTHLDEMLRDRFVLGLLSDDIRRRLMVEESLKHKKAVEMAMAIEQISERIASTNSSEVAFVGGRGRGRGWPTGRGRGRGGRGSWQADRAGAAQTQTTTTGACASCGAQHRRETCRLRNVRCNNCGKIGHIQKVCRAPRKLQKNKTITINKDEIIEEDVVTVTYNRRASDAMKVSVFLNDRQYKMLLDTGAARTLVSERTWNDIGRPQIQPTRLRLVTYTGEAIRLLGQARVKVRHRGKQLAADVVITAGDRQDVLGRDLLQILLPELATVCEPQVVGVVKKPKTDEPTTTLQQVLDRHQALFGDDFGCIKEVKASIRLKENAQPKFCRARPVAFAKKQKITQELDRLEKLGIVTKVDYSKYASPVVAVTKPSGATRLCGDYKVSLNKQIEVDSYPLPRPEELFAQLAGGKKFSKIDLAEAYLQVEVDDASKKLLTVNTHQGLYQYNRLPFGVASAPAIFQRTMEQITSGLEGVGVYLDDIIVTGRDDREHLANLDKLLQRLENFGVRVKVGKCKFLANEIKYLGYILDKHGRRPNLQKVKAIEDMPPPTDTAEARSFLGMVRYYDKFIPGMSSLTKPINELLKKATAWS